MKRSSVEYIWIPILGPSGWNTSASAVDVSIDGGTTWVAASVDNSTAVAVTLRNNVVGTRAYVKVLSSTLAIPGAAESITFLVRPTANPETPVIEAGSIPIE